MRQYFNTQKLKQQKIEIEDIRYCVPFGYWLDAQEMPIIHEHTV
ncbi:hypothetical protein CLOBOL_00379 [Enterocloster bolteae ATCC BAA-613]|uniref:Uncharacterized protein n=1 Tax=Enterocloster bolteae (strain ATCC BAA-613 / DSM 15670 / CCUG 46953 / JCM 12243 / WAL 16351) TaxID=411902 RepID=A8RHD0_ENTBW|nr:hypothetical protein CLOBOL_00379 [Enterocloster bolteae ATCC BAA-613]